MLEPSIKHLAKPRFAKNRSKYYTIQVVRIFFLLRGNISGDTRFCCNASVKLGNRGILFNNKKHEPTRKNFMGNGFYWGNSLFTP